MRRTSVVNSSLRRKPTSASVSGARTAVSASSTSTGTWVSRMTSALDSRAWSANVMRLSRRLSCLISEARASSVSRSPNSLISSAAVFTPMPGTPGTLSDESPIKACTSITLDGRHAETLDHFGLADRLVLHGVVHDDAGLHELHQVLVGRHDGHLGAGLDRLERIGGDDVVGLVAFLLDAGDVEGAHRIAHQRELGNEVVGRLGPVGLVALEQIAPEGLGRIVEDHREMGGRRELAALAQQLPQHGAEAVHRADRQPVGRPGQRRQRVKSAENVARAVDQIDVVAARDRLPGGGGLGFG